VKIFIISFLLSFSVLAESESCKVATVKYEGALETYLDNQTVVDLGLEAYEICKEDLVVEEQAMVEDTKEECFSDDTLSNALKVDCAFRAVEYFLYSKFD